MARFGLDDSSSEDEGASVDLDRTLSDHGDESGGSGDSDAQTEGDDGIPRASYNDQDESGSEMDDDNSEAGQAQQRREPSMSQSARSHSQSVHSRARSSSSGSDSDEDLPRRRLPAQRSLSVASSRAPTEREKSVGPAAAAWAPQPLKLEPKRIAVMQASFFQQPIKEVEHEKEPPKKVKENPWLPPSASLGRPEQSTAARPNFATPVLDPNPFRSFRKYSRVELPKSITAGKEGSFVDSGLMLGRSFRVGWGPSGQIVHFGSLYGSAKLPASSDLAVSTFRCLAQSDDLERTKSESTLQQQLLSTPIYLHDDIPEAVPHPDLNFGSFASIDHFRTSKSSEANLWRLGAALFDEIEDLNAPEDATAELVARLVEIRRRDRLESWLEDVVRDAVEEDLKDIESRPSGTAAGAKRIFALLSGHEVERACTTAGENGDLRLATLLAQAGGDDEFREDVYLQLAKWREYRVDSHIDAAYRRVYEVLCGNVGISEGLVPRGDRVDAAAEILIADGLDWKRAFGLHLWYGTFQASLPTVVQRYETAARDSSTHTAPPLPLYIESPTFTTPTSPTLAWNPNTTDPPPTDPLFSLIKIFTDPTYSLEDALLPRNFGSSPLDYRLPWHLYILFSRVLRRRDFEDREMVFRDDASDDDDMSEIQIEGYSVRADVVTEAYASQLELGGNWTWAIFVLLHLQVPELRAKAIKDVLGRNANDVLEELDDEDERNPEDAAKVERFTFLTVTLKIPSTWIFSAQAIAAKYARDPYREYQLHVKAEQWNEAHTIAVNELAPEAIMHNSPNLLRAVFAPFDARQVADWESGGKIFLDYALCVEELKAHLQGQRVASLLLDLIRAVPTLADGSPTLKLQAAVSQMQSQLTVLSSMFNLHANAIRPSTLREADRLVWLDGANASFLQKSMDAACAA
ncbi:hypothetical protein RQP46_008166 [Phenoliferia psychrophenolica]